jgi:hypothetical protein
MPDGAGARGAARGGGEGDGDGARRCADAVGRGPLTPAFSLFSM